MEINVVEYCPEPLAENALMNSAEIYNLVLVVLLPYGDFHKTFCPVVVSHID